MNKILSIFVLIGLVAFQACEGPEGPMGPQGEQGLQGVPGTPGVNIVGTTYEATVDFTADGGWGVVLAFPEELVESDVILTYILWDVDDERPIWRAVPQTIFFPEGPLVYNFDFTQVDIRLFLEGPLNKATLDDVWTKEQIFRIVVVPSDFPDARIDFTDYEAVTKMLGIKDSDFQKLEVKK
ncbi:collagen-like protein [Algoriphagus sp. H41]|uniref:Collagen-like protein n=1 Tax=Algoriphagus oliviformis TaxID=2811231 RepID=A0ABS3C339_9BACT|nr:collagen-like protein [Algoriphagus oliviformis]MBN7811383.1 collagen-like protein [Algoriphagus oliviformis]